MIVLKTTDLLIPTSEGKAPEIRANLPAGFRPSGRVDVPFWSIESPIDWAADPFIDRNWQFQLHAWYLMRPYLTLYQLENDSSMLRPMLDIALDWHSFHIERKQEAPLSWKDMAVGRRSAILAFLLSAALRGEVAASADELYRLQRLCRIHFLRLIDARYFTMTNHGFAQIHGLMALCKVIPNAKEAKRGFKFVAEKFSALLKQQFSNDGVHTEHSPEYHFFVLNTVKAMMLTGWYSEFTEVVELIKKVDQVAPWLIMPDGRYISIGDSSVTAPSSSRIARYKAEMAKFAPARQFDVGYGIIRSPFGEAIERQHLLFFMASFQSPGHKQSDDLSIFWHDVGQDILIDPGKFSYTVDKWREYFLSTRAHNTVEIDGKNFSRLAADAYGSALQVLESKPFGFVSQGQVFHKAQATEHCRQLVYAPQKFLVVIDRMKSLKRHNYTQWFHFAPHFELTGEGSRYTAKSGSSTVTIASAATRPLVSNVVTGATEPRIQGWCSENYNHRVPCPTIGLTARGENVTFATVMSLQGNPIDIKISAIGAVHILDGQHNIVGPLESVLGARVRDAQAAPVA
jgi:hypothetical protein